MASGNTTRTLPEWLFLVFLALVTGLAGVHLPLLNFLAMVIFPLPVMLMVVRFDLRYALLGLAAAGILMLFYLPNPELVLDLLVHFGLLGILFGLLFKNGVPSGKNIAAGLMGTAVLAVVSVSLIFAVTGVNHFSLSPEERQLLAEHLAGQTPGSVAELPPELQETFSGLVVGLFDLLLPGQLIVVSLAAAALTFFLARWVLWRLGFALPPPLVFSLTALPWYSVWALIGGLGMTLAGDQFSLAAAARAGQNVLFIMAHVYLVQGLAVAAYFFNNWRIIRPLKIILLVSAVLYLPISAAVLVLLGVIDPLFNLRRLPAPEE